jgi:hypothetical protein
MAKKSTHWVTIPEEAIHTPASKSAARESAMSGKGKLFWGTSFAALVLVIAVLLAPQEMANLLQGNLFDQTGLPATTETVSEDKQPVEIADAEAITETTGQSLTGQSDGQSDTEQVTAQPAAEQPGVQPSGATFTQPETEAVSIQVEPIKPADSGQQNPAEDGVNTAAQGEAVTTGGIKEELDANKKLLEQLSQQVAEFKEKDQQKTAIIEDLTKIAQGQTADIHSSAPETDAAIPAAVTTTATIGQVQTGYRVNTHTVQITPYQALQQNTMRFQAQQQISGTSMTAEDYSAQLAQAKGTPESGPREAILIALSVTFLSLIGWKIGKFART